MIPITTMLSLSGLLFLLDHCWFGRHSRCYGFSLDEGAVASLYLPSAQDYREKVPIACRCPVLFAHCMLIHDWRMAIDFAHIFGIASYLVY